MKTPVNKSQRETTVSQAEFARLVGVTPAAVQQWRAKGIVTACSGSKIKVQAALIELVAHLREQSEARESDPLRAEKIRKLKSENDANERRVVEWASVHALHHRLYAVLVNGLRSELVYQGPVFLVGRDIHDIRLAMKVGVSRAIESVRITLEEWSSATGPADSAGVESIMRAFPPIIWPGNTAEVDAGLERLKTPVKPARKSKAKTQ